MSIIGKNTMLFKQQALHPADIPDVGMIIAIFKSAVLQAITASQ